MIDIAKYQNYVWLLVVVLLVVYIFKYLGEKYQGIHTQPTNKDPGNDNNVTQSEGFTTSQSNNDTPDELYWQRTYEPENQFNRWSGKIITNEKEKVKRYKDKRPFHYPSVFPPLSHLGKLQYLPNRRRSPTRESVHTMLKEMSAPPYVVSRTLKKLNMENNPDDYMLKTQWLPKYMTTGEFDASHIFHPAK